MSKNPDIPDGLAIPDELAKKVNEAFNRKSITPEDELADALKDMARDIALIEPDSQIGERGLPTCWNCYRRKPKRTAKMQPIKTCC